MRSECVEIHLQQDVRLRLYADDELSRLIYCEDFEWQERGFLNGFLRPSDVFVDVGANLGLFTVLAARRVGPGGRVLAFEPSPRAFRRLQENVALNGFTNVACHRVALSDRGGQATLTVSADGHEAWSSLARPAKGAAFAAETVPTAAWDDFTREHGLLGRVALMKIDVEGWESRVLAGAREALRRPDAPVLQVELTDAVSRAAGSSCARVYGMLEGLGYQLFTFDGLARRLVPDPLREEYPYLNLIAAKRPADVAARLAAPPAHRGRARAEAR
jgi:FkbM family methyltransferase